MTKLTLKKYIPTAPLIALLIATSFFNTEYNIKLILLTATAVLSISLWAFYPKKDQKINPKLHITTLSYIGLSILSYIFSQTSNVGLAELTQGSTYLLLFLTLTNLSSTTLNTKKLTQVFAKLTIAIQSTFIFHQIFILKVDRAYGTFFHWFDHRLIYPNALALSLLMSLYLLQNDKVKNKTPWTFLATTGLLFTYSRGAIIAGILTGLILLSTQIIHKKYKQLLTSSLTILLSITLFLFSNTFLLQSNQTQLDQKFTFQGTEKITSVMERLQFFTQTPKLIIKQPVLGFGPNSFQYTFPLVQEIPLSNSQHPHNIFLKISTERGILTLLAFALLILLTTHKIFHNKDYLHNLNLVLALFSAMLHSQIDYNFNLPLNSLLIIVILSAIWQPTSTYSTKKQTNLALPILVTIFSIILFGKHFTYKLPNLSPFKLENINYLDSSIKASNQSNNQATKITILEKHTQNNQYDSFGFSHLGHLYQENNQPTKAAQAFHKSIEINPKNFWYPYNQLTYIYKTIPQTKTNLTKSWIQNTIQNLDQYQVAAQQNLHYTSQSDNIIQAIQTSENLLELNLQEDQKQQVSSILNSLRSSYKRFNRN